MSAKGVAAALIEFDIDAAALLPPPGEYPIVTKGKKFGQYIGRVAVRATGSFNIQTHEGVVQGISHKHCKVIQRADGYGYSQAAYTDATGKPPKQGRLSPSALCLPGLKAEVSRAI